MTSPSMSTTVGDSRDERQPLRDAQDWLTGPLDAATQAWIDASVAQYEEHRARVETACSGLLIGTADYGKRAVTR